jgi:hypothetical protein
MDLGIAGIPQRVETTAPRGDEARAGGDDQTSDPDAKCATGEQPQERLELAAGNGRTNVVEECKKLQEAKDTYTELAKAQCDI